MDMLSYSAPPSPLSPRLDEIESLTTEIGQAPTSAQDGDFSAFGMLITDASLAGDAPALEGAMRNLQWLHRRYSEQPDSAIEAQFRGRVLGLIDVTHWSLRRLPSTLQLKLNPDSHATRFLTTLASRPGLSNTDLARWLSVDETEISRLGRRLLAAGVVGRRKAWRHNVWALSPRGRQYLESSGLLRDRRYSVGIKVLPDRMIGVVMDRETKTLNQLGNQRPLRAAGNLGEVVEKIAKFANWLIAKYAPDATTADWVLGVEVGGHVSAKDGRVVCAPNYGRDGWADLELRAAIEARLEGVQVTIENDANALALLEQQCGGSGSPDNAVTVVLDEGIGCGIVANGEVVHGDKGAAGELGHFVIDPSGDECQRCGKNGCVETFAGIGALVGKAGVDRPSLMRGLGEAVTRANAGDEVVTKKLQQAGEALGRALAILASTLDPAQITLYAPQQLIAGDQGAAQALLSKMRETTVAYASFDSGRRLQFATKEYSEHVGAQAAAVVALLRLGVPAVSGG